MIDALVHDTHTDITSPYLKLLRKKLDAQETVSREIKMWSKMLDNFDDLLLGITVGTEQPLSLAFIHVVEVYRF